MGDAGGTQVSTATSTEYPVWVRAKSFAARESSLYISTVVVTIMVTIFALRLWRADWKIPFYYSADAILNFAGFKTVAAHGWYEIEPLLNAPHGQSFHDWKIADNLGYMVAAVGNFLVHDSTLVLNLYYVLGFPLAALTAVVFFRKVGVGRAMTLTMAVLFAIAPYHFARNETHLFLGEYFPIPLAMVVVYQILQGKPIWRADTGSGWRAWVSLRSVGTLLALALVSTATTYYGLFTILLIAFAGLVALIRTHSWRRFFGAVVAGVVAVVVLLANMFPDLLDSAIRGSNPAAVVRSPAGVEVYALKFIELILPTENYSIGPLGSLRTYYDQNLPLPGEGPSLGLIGSVGFLIALAFVIYLGASIRARGVASPTLVAVGALSSLIAYAFLLGTIGGLSSVFGFLTSDIRGWNRLSIVIALFSLAIVGLLLDRLRPWIVVRRRWGSRDGVLLSGVMVVVLLAIGSFDQLPAASAPDYATSASQWKADDALVHGIESAVGSNASIAQLPFREFPETAPVNGVPDTDQLKPFLHSATLTWSGGGVKGRPTTEWLGVIEKLPVDRMTETLAAAGFGGILIDRQEYGKQADVVEDGLKVALGTPKVISHDGRMVFFSLAKAKNRVVSQFTPSEVRQLGTAAVDPVQASFIPDVSLGFAAIDLLKAYHPEIQLDNARNARVTVTVSFHIRNYVGTSVLRFATPDGQTHDVKVGPDKRMVTFTVTAAPGRSTVPITVLSGDPLPRRITASPALEVSDFRVADLAMNKLLDRI